MSIVAFRNPGGSRKCALGFSDKISLEPSSLETPLVAFDIFVAPLCQTELTFLKFPADKDEALFFGFAQSFQARAFGGRLPIHAKSAMQQYHYLDNFVSPALMLTDAIHSFARQPPQRPH
jgi:hypothetical protein